MPTLHTLQQTYLKLTTDQASTLPNTQKQLLGPDFVAPLAAYLLVNDHYKVTLGKDSLGNQIAYQGHNTWFVYAPHVTIYGADGKPIDADQRTNAAGLTLIKEFEGCVLHAYQDAVGVWTIGYGHCGGDVYPGLSITQEQADALLVQDLQRFEAEVRRLVTVPLSDNQFAALVSFDYNTGSLATSTLLRLLNAGDKMGAADQFLSWVHAGGQTLPGLVRRRQAERELFLS